MLGQNLDRSFSTVDFCQLQNTIIEQKFFFVDNSLIFFVIFIYGIIILEIFYFITHIKDFFFWIIAFIEFLIISTLIIYLCFFKLYGYSIFLLFSIAILVLGACDSILIFTFFWNTILIKNSTLFETIYNLKIRENYIFS